MVKRILIDIDTQYDFMDRKGSLYVESSDSVREAIREVLNSDYDAVIGSVDSHAYDSWEFKSNGGPFAPHCVKGTRGWLRVHQDAPEKQRFVPMTSKDSVVLVGEKGREDGVRALTAKDLAVEAVERKVGLYFEKEVYSMFSNPMAELVLQEIGCVLGVDWDQIQIDVIGYCTGGYCVDAAVERLCNMDSVFESKIRVLSYATAAIGGLEGMNLSKNRLTSYGAEWIA